MYQQKVPFNILPLGTDISLQHYFLPHKYNAVGSFTTFTLMGFSFMKCTIFINYSSHIKQWRTSILYFVRLYSTYTTTHQQYVLINFFLLNIRPTHFLSDWLAVAENITNTSIYNTNPLYDIFPCWMKIKGQWKINK